MTTSKRTLRRHNKPDIFNTDQRSQYAGEAFPGLSKDLEAEIDMYGKEPVMDYIMIERLWMSVQHAEIYIHDYESVEDLVIGYCEYFAFHNHHPPRRNLGERTPAEVYDRADMYQEAA